MADYYTVLSSRHCMLYRQMDGNAYVYAMARQTQAAAQVVISAVRLAKRQAPNACTPMRDPQGLCWSGTF